MNKVGLYITTLLHDITQEHYKVTFERDFKGSMRMDFTRSGVADFYEHAHCGYPGAPRERLERDIIDSLIWFKSEFSIEDSRGDDNDPNSAA